MLSICIPVYNFDITHLAQKLNGQVKAGNVSVEVVFLDDGSDTPIRDINKQVAGLEHVIYKEQENAGRSQTRNRLASIATGNYLVFMDCDCDVPDGFVLEYLHNIHPEAVVVGGLQYGPCPAEASKKLRWKVGIKREVKTVDERRKKPYNNFLSSNFMMPKRLMDVVLFETKLTGYGHEDTLFGIALKKADVPMIHIDNPVWHLGIDEARVYLDKLEQSINNIPLIEKMDVITDEIKVLKYYRLLCKLWLQKPIAYLFRMFQPTLRKRFNNGCSNLFLLDLYKLGMLCNVRNF
jgi:glycosyltransferase involved in cell wall biosynthesis